jgi:peptide/nickel transport system permease protein
VSILTSKEKRIILSRKIKGFWEEFWHNRIGKLGLSIVLLYLFVAIFASYLTPYPPIALSTRAGRLAESFAMPEWMTLFPENSDLPPTMTLPFYWEPLETPPSVTVFPGVSLQVKYDGKGAVRPTDIYLVNNFSYPYKPPYSFNFGFRWTAENVTDTRYFLELLVVPPPPNNNQTRVWPIPQADPLPSEQNATAVVHMESSDDRLLRQLGLDPGKDNLAQMLFSEKGEYTLILHMAFMPQSEKANCDVTFDQGYLSIPGLYHGILGTDFFGGDVFTQLVYGARISLLIGISAALLSTSIGIIIGVTAGYTGGITDEISMRVVDILLCLPVLPLLIALVYLFGKSVWYIVLLVAVFGWQGLARIVRSHVLSIRETAFIECAKAAGASRSYIILKHLVPNVMPIAFASLVLAVPGAILTEAGLSFLGFGDPASPTWGRMLNGAFYYGAFARYAWWYILPPGLAITFLCLAFVFIGHAVDEIVNPRLRRRR